MKEFKKDGVLLNGFHKVRTKKLKCSGTFKNGKLNGKGKCEFFHKIKKSDIRTQNTNDSTIMLPTPSLLDGEWVKNDLVKGKKVCHYYSKKTKKIHDEIHNGTFKNGKLDGKGSKKWHNGSENGIYKNGKLNGRCLIKWQNGNLVRGVCKNDNIVKGKVIYHRYDKSTKKTQKQIAVGTFKKNGKLDGQGKSISDYYSKKTKKMEKNVDIGTFKNGKLNGECVKKWRNATYKGLCKNGIRYGQGTYIFEGKKQTGIWRDNNVKLNEPDNAKLYSYLQNLKHFIFK